jgi:hypothetical protein
VIDYLAGLYVQALILLSCLGWMALLFWGPIWLAEKILRIVYQDAPQQLYTSETDEPKPNGECDDCGAPIWVNELDETCQRCDLCAAIRRAELEYNRP